MACAAGVERRRPPSPREHGQAPDGESDASLPREADANLVAGEVRTYRAVAGYEAIGAVVVAGSLDEASMHPLRELHCVHAMLFAMKKDARPHRVAVLWGRNRASSDRFPRLVPPEWTSFSISLLDAPASADLVLVDPISFGATVVLDSPDGAKHFERKRAKGGAGRASRLSSSTKKTARAPSAWIDGKAFDDRPTNIAGGHHLLAVETNGKTIIAAIELPANGAVEVEVADDPPEITATIVEP